MIKRKSKHEFRVHLAGIAPKPLTAAELPETIDWCTDTFGSSGRDKKYRWRYGWTQHREGMFYFRSENDALFFVLKWS